MHGHPCVPGIVHSCAQLVASRHGRAHPAINRAPAATTSSNSFSPRGFVKPSFLLELQHQSSPFCKIDKTLSFLGKIPENWEIPLVSTKWANESIFTLFLPGLVKRLSRKKGILGLKISQNQGLSTPQKVVTLDLLAQVHGASFNQQRQARVASTGNLVLLTRLTEALNSSRNLFSSINFNTMEII